MPGPPMNLRPPLPVLPPPQSGGVGVRKDRRGGSDIQLAKFLFREISPCGLDREALCACAKTTSDLPAIFATSPLPAIENWSLKICHWPLKSPSKIANDKFSIFNSQLPSSVPPGQPHIKFTGSMSTDIFTSSGSARPAASSASSRLSRLIRCVNNMI